jgi:phytoene synthase
MDLVRAADRDRYLATLFAPAQRRDALYALYAFNIEIGRVRDATREPMPGEIRLQWWREAIAGERESEAAAHPVASALRATMARHRIERDRLTALIDAHAVELYDDLFATLDDLDNHGALTEGIVLGAAGKILVAEGLAVDALARHAGIALTIARNLVLLPSRALRHWIGIPREVHERHGVAVGSVLARQDSDALKAALAETRRHARRQLQAASLEAGEAPAALMPALLPLASVGPQLRRMDRRGYEPFAPDVLSPLARQWLIWRASRDARRIFAV